MTEARQCVSGFVDWYNFEHRHSAIQFVIPEQRHADLDTAILAQRQVLYQTAKAQHPARWSHRTRNWKPVQVVYLNPNKSDHNTTPNTLDMAT